MHASRADQSNCVLGVLTDFKSSPASPIRYHYKVGAPLVNPSTQGKRNALENSQSCQSERFLPQGPLARRTIDPHARPDRPQCRTRAPTLCRERGNQRSARSENRIKDRTGTVALRHGPSVCVPWHSDQCAIRVFAASCGTTIAQNDAKHHTTETLERDRKSVV